MICTTASGPAVAVRNRGVAAVSSRPLACVGSVRARLTAHSPAQPIPTVFGECKAVENPIHARLVFQCQPISLGLAPAGGADRAPHNAQPRRPVTAPKAAAGSAGASSADQPNMGAVLSAVGVACMGAFAFGYHLGVVNGPLEAIAAELGFAGNQALSGLVGGMPAAAWAKCRPAEAAAALVTGTPLPPQQLHVLVYSCMSCVRTSSLQQLLYSPSQPLSACAPVRPCCVASKPWRCCLQVVSSTLLGAAVGSLTGGGFADALGRRKAFMLCAVPMLVGPLLSAFASDLNTMVAGRFLAGLAIGLSSALVPLYVSEVSRHGPPATPFHLDHNIQASWLLHP